MYSSFANMSNSPLIYWFTIGMLIAVPIAMFIIRTTRTTSAPGMPC